MVRRVSALAKLTRPRIRGAVRRERLFRLLDDARRHPLTWVVGPPGAGKTTLVAAYLDGHKVKGIWYHADSGDGDAASFFYYLGQAAAHINRTLRHPLPLLAPEYLADLSGFARRYFRMLYAALPRGAAIVFDNYHDVPSRCALHELIATAAEELPAHVNLIFISRAAPPKQLARERMATRLSVIDWDDLQLQPDETRAMATAHGIVDERIVRSVHEQCGGWIGGLRLILEELQQGGAVHHLRLSDTLDTVFNYFADQVFDATPSATQRFLLRTAVLPSMTASVARAVSEEPRAAQILEDLYRRHLFTHRRAGVEPIYQYHALFRTFLLAQASDSIGRGGMADLRSRAAELLESHGLLEESVETYQAAERWDEVGRLAVINAPNLLAQGRGQTLRRWISALPAQDLRQAPWLLYWLGTSFIPIDQERARIALQQAHSLFAAEAEHMGQLLCTSGIIEAHFLQHDDHRLVDPWLPVHERLLAQLEPTAEAELQLRAFSVMLIMLLYRQPGNPLLKTCVARVVELLSGEAGANQKITAATFVMWYCGYTGDFATARAVASHGEALAANEEVTPLNRGNWWCWLGYCLGFMYDLPGARLALRRALQIGESNGLASVTFLASYFVGLKELQFGRDEDVEPHMRRAEAVASSGAQIQTGILHAFRGWVALYREEPRRAMLDGAAAWDIAHRLTSPSYLVHWGTPMIYGLVESGRLEQAAERLAQQRFVLRDTNIHCFDPMLLCIEATIALRRGDEARARWLVEPMFRLAREGQHGAYLDLMRPWLPDLAAMALEDGIETDYVREWIQLGNWRPRSQSMQDWPWEWTVVTLGRFKVLHNGRPLEYGRKTPKKPLALLRALIAAGEKGVSELALADALWPDDDADAGSHSLRAAIHRLRTLLGGSPAVQVRDNQVRLDAARVWVDAWSFEACLEEARGMTGLRQEHLALRALALYQGAFLGDDSDSSWGLSTRERLRAKFVRSTGQLAPILEASGKHEQAAEVYRRGLELDNLVEGFCQGYMRCCAKLNRPADGISAYRRLRQTLAITVGRSPSRETEALFQRLVAPE